jgi:hypothetical protein
VSKLLDLLLHGSTLSPGDRHRPKRPCDESYMSDTPPIPMFAQK